MGETSPIVQVIGETPCFRHYDLGMTSDEAKALIIDGIAYAAYKETDSSLHDSDKNRLFGSDRYKSGRAVVENSTWAEGDFEGKMAMLLRWANVLNPLSLAFAEAQTLLEGEGTLIGRVIRRSKPQVRLQRRRKRR